MPTLNFPAQPQDIGNTYTFNNKTWVWNGQGWALTSELTNLTVTGNINTGNLISAGIVSAAEFVGNISGNIDAAGSNTQVQFNDTGDILGASSNFTFNKSTNILSVTGTIEGTTITAVGNVAGSNIKTSNITIASDAITGTNTITVTPGTSGQVVVEGNLVPSSNVAYSLGTNTNRWQDLWISNSSIYMGSVVLGSVGNILTINGANALVGNAGADFTTTGNITGGNLSGTNVTGTLTTAAQPNITSVGALTGLTVNGSSTLGGFTINGNTLSSAGSTMTLDPSAAGATGLVVIAGNLQVQGTTTTIDSTTVTINDLVFTVANNAATASAANGGGIEVGPAGSPYATWTYDQPNSRWTTSLSVNATGNISGGNVSGTTGTFTNVAGTLTTAAQPNITSVGSLTSLTVTGNASTGNVSGTTGTFTNVAGTLTTAAQPNITSVGTLGSLAVTGNISGGNILTTGLVSTDSNIFLTSNGNARKIEWSGSFPSYIEAQSGASTIGYVYIVPGNAGKGVKFDYGGQTIIENLSNSTSSSSGALTVAGGAGVAGNIYAGGLISATGNITGGNLSGTNVTGTLTTAAQPNITSVGSLTSLTVTGNASTGNVSGTTGTFTNVAGTLTTAAQPNITSVGTLGSLTVTGNITGGNLTVTTGTVTLGNIVNANANGIGNIGSSALYFDTVFAKATSAQYADVAEKYLADANYPVGTVLIFGGDNEVTQSQTSHQTSIAGSVSENPSYIMNAGLEGQWVVIVALLGRVPVRVKGPISKGDLLVASDTPGVACRMDPVQYAPGCVIGKALTDHDGSGIIEAVVGRL